LSVADADAWRTTMLAGGLQDVPGEWDRLAAAYYLVGDTQALDRLLEHKPQAAVGIGDLHASADNWQQAIDSYNRLISPETTDAGVLVKRGEAYGALEQWDNAQSDWRRASKLQPGVLRETFDRLRLAGHWQPAAMMGAMLIEQDPDNRFLWLRTAPAFVLAEDEQGYREFCRRMVAQFHDTTDQFKAESTCKCCLLAPGAVDISTLPLKLFSESLDQGTTPAGLHAWAWAARALVAYRSGEMNQAGQYTQQAFKSQPSVPATALTYSIAALERHGRGDFDGAREALGHATRMIDQHLSGANANQLHDWTMPLILAREAQNLLDGELAPETTDSSEGTPPSSPGNPLSEKPKASVGASDLDQATAPKPEC
jgi:tetratricopeptide (TPR) repeat protein